MVHIVNLYGHSGAMTNSELMEANESLLADVFLEAASLGGVPVIILGDFNVEPRRSAVLNLQTASGAWTDLAKAEADTRQARPEDTYAGPRGASSRIDCVFVNRAALAKVRHSGSCQIPGVRTTNSSECASDLATGT